MLFMTSSVTVLSLKIALKGRRRKKYLNFVWPRLLSDVGLIGYTRCIFRLLLKKRFIFLKFILIQFKKWCCSKGNVEFCHGFVLKKCLKGWRKIKVFKLRYIGLIRYTKTYVYLDYYLKKRFILKFILIQFIYKNQILFKLIFFYLTFPKSHLYKN